MEIRKTTVGVLATLCIGAGAGGAYLATRGEQPAPASVEPESAVVGQPSPSATVAEPPPPPTLVADDPAPLVASSSTPSPPPQPPASMPRRTELPEPEPDFAEMSPDLPAELDTLPVPAVILGSAAPMAVTPVRPTATLGTTESPAAEFEEFVVSTDAVIGLQVETFTTSESARVEDEVVAHVTRDVRVRERVVIPAGAEARGEVALVDRGGQLRGSARLGVRFTMVVLADGTRIPIETDMIYREGAARGRQSASRIGGGAIGGAIIGGIFGGARGAAIGGSVGAGAGTAAALAASRDPAVLTRGAAITVRITAPTTVILPRE